MHKICLLPIVMEAKYFIHLLSSSLRSTANVSKFWSNYSYNWKSVIPSLLTYIYSEKYYFIKVFPILTKSRWALTFLKSYYTSKKARISTRCYVTTTLVFINIRVFYFSYEESVNDDYGTIEMKQQSQNWIAKNSSLRNFLRLL